MLNELNRLYDQYKNAVMLETYDVKDLIDDSITIEDGHEETIILYYGVSMPRDEYDRLLGRFSNLNILENKFIFNSLDQSKIYAGLYMGFDSDEGDFWELSITPEVRSLYARLT